MQRLLIVSNRLPVSVQKRKDNLHFEVSVGGLATGLGSFHESQNSVWIGWPGIDAEKVEGDEKTIEAQLQSERCYPVFLSENDVEDYYHGFCNGTIWPLFHYFSLYATYSQDLWQAYERINEAFCDKVLEVARPGDIVWVQDYHLMLLPRLLSQRLPHAAIGFFLHIPFPSFEIFRLLPWRKEILDGLLGANLVGFHTYDYAWHFLDSVHRLLGYEAVMGQITTAEHVVKADAFPMGIDYRRYSTAMQDSKARAEMSRFRRKLGNRTIILSIDRLDYTSKIGGFWRLFGTAPRVLGEADPDSSRGSLPYKGGTLFLAEETGR
jgi:trehalose 6-phosphate synthase/phosphatase